jgi:hypothetical protein
VRIWPDLWFYILFLAIMEMEEEGVGRWMLLDLRDGEDRLLLLFGAHTRRRFVDDLRSSCRRLLWPNGGCSELWRAQLIFGSLAGVISSSTSWLACQSGGPTAPEVRRSSVVASQVVSSLAMQLLAATGVSDARKVAKDLIAFLVFLRGSWL